MVEKRKDEKKRSKRELGRSEKIAKQNDSRQTQQLAAGLTMKKGRSHSSAAKRE